MKVALVHDWLINMRGGEKVLEILCELYPEADIYTLLYDKAKVSKIISNMSIKTSFIQKLPWASDPAIAVRRVILVGFPACFSATVVDSMNR